ENAELGRPYYLHYGDEEKEQLYVKTEDGVLTKAKITFVNADTAPQYVDVGEKAVAPTAPTRYRYVFAGWYVDAACTTEYNFDTLVLANITLYAKWVDDTELNNRLMINALTTSLFRNFSVRATANEGGTLTNEGLVFTMFNNRLTYKATPNEGYEVVSFIVDGVDLGPITEYKFDRITANHTVEVVFAPIADDAE
nr:InlB B-repeat-containing protein [Clostridia bacterium]